MRRCDIKIPVKPKITPWLKYNHMMEIVNQVAQDFASIHKSTTKKENSKGYEKIFVACKITQTFCTQYS